MRHRVLFLLLCLLVIVGESCVSAPSPTHSTDPTLPEPSQSKAQPGLPLPVGFDIRVAGDIVDRELALAVSVDVPEGSYVISALSDRDYLGKFQVSWSDSSVQASGALIETPVSMPGWEPWDRVYTPMLFSPTVLRQTWRFPTQLDTLKGQVFFVLEPQCVPYALDFKVATATGAFTSGWVHPQYPE